jgi:hypothetical protein
MEDVSAEALAWLQAKGTGWMVWKRRGRWRFLLQRGHAMDYSAGERPWRECNNGETI